MQVEQEHPAIFAQRFLRSHHLLHSIACRILGDEERAFLAIENCRRIASRNPPHFVYEGEFRSWLLRVLIEEALTFVRERQGEMDPAAVVKPISVSMSESTEKPELG